MKLGGKERSAFDDRIDLKVSPSNLETLIELTKKRAMEEENYSFVGIYRNLKDYLQERYDEWEKLREEKDRRERKGRGQISPSPLSVHTIP